MSPVEAGQLSPLLSNMIALVVEYILLEDAGVWCKLAEIELFRRRVKISAYRPSDPNVDGERLVSAESEQKHARGHLRTDAVQLAQHRISTLILSRRDCFKISVAGGDCCGSIRHIPRAEPHPRRRDPLDARVRKRLFQTHGIAQQYRRAIQAARRKACKVCL